MKLVYNTINKILIYSMAPLLTTLPSFVDTNPLSQFDIRELLSLNVLGLINISLTNIGLYLILASIVILTLFLLSNNYNKLVSNN